ncbi:MAG TPA: cobalamin-binding protein [Anaerolineae bacterium]|nr:cobalamin-binding protein [Anaerolineae bacterium]
MNEILKSIYAAVLTGDMTTTQEQVEEAIKIGLTPADILQEGLISAMTEVGRRFEAGDYYVPEMLIAARAMKGGLTILKPLLAASDVQPLGKIVLGTVKGDLHDIGKNLVSMMLEGAGFEIVDLGVDIPPDKFVEAIRSGGIDVLGMSALLTTTMPLMKATIDALVDAQLRDQVKVIIGGAPVTQSYADDIGADGYAPDASRAASLTKSLVG